MRPLRNMILVHVYPHLYVPDSMVISPTSHDAPFNSKFNMAVVKPEVLITQAVYQLEGKFQRLHPHFPLVPVQWRTVRRSTCLIPADVGRYRKRKMATAKPEVVISHVLQQIDTRFERLYLGFRGRPTRRSHRRHPSTLSDTRNARWRPPNRK